jgi:hypothetical protein
MTENPFSSANRFPSSSAVLSAEASPDPRQHSGRLRRWAGAVAATLTLGAGVAGANVLHDSELVEAQTSVAATLTVADTNSILWLHPNDAAVHTKVTDQMPDGTPFDTQCFKHGEKVNGRTDVWYFGTNRTTNNSGYASADYLHTATRQRSDTIAGTTIPECGKPQAAQVTPGQVLQPATPLQGHEAAPQSSNIYNRERAATWAYAHGKDQPPSNGSCTWFASLALWQGGLAKTPEWTSEGYLGSDLIAKLPVWHKKREFLPGTTAAWSVREFKSYLEKTYPRSREQPLSFARKT